MKRCFYELWVRLLNPRLCGEGKDIFAPREGEVGDALMYTAAWRKCCAAQDEPMAASARMTHPQYVSAFGMKGAAPESPPVKARVPRGRGFKPMGLSSTCPGDWENGIKSQRGQILNRSWRH